MEGGGGGGWCYGCNGDRFGDIVKRCIPLDVFEYKDDSTGRCVLTVGVLTTFWAHDHLQCVRFLIT